MEGISAELIKLLSNDGTARIVLISLIMFIVLIAIMIFLIIQSMKWIKSIREESRSEYDKEQNLLEYQQQVTDSKQDIADLTRLIVKLTESINASNKATDEKLDNIRKSLAANTGGCEFGKTLSNDIDRMRDTVIKELRDSVDLLIDSDKESIKAFITGEYHKWMGRGEIDIYSLRTIDERFARYLKEKGNTFVQDMVRELHLLPQICQTKNCTTERMIADRDSVSIHDHHEDEDKEDLDENDELGSY